MIRSIIALAFGALALSACAGAPPVNRTSSEPLSTVAQVDLSRYVGLWHEAARLPNQFERGCVAATATYTQRPDGMIGVRNACTKADGSVNDVNGRAKVVDAATNAKLKVSFFGPFWGDYWVLDLAPDYSWAIVGEGSGRYLWVLTRVAQIDAQTKAELVDRLRARGYDTQKLYWNPGNPD